LNHSKIVATKDARQKVCFEKVYFAKKESVRRIIATQRKNIALHVSNDLGRCSQMTII